MKRNLHIVAAVALASLASAAEPVKIVLTGDSTVNDEGGWGIGFRASFAPPVEVVNLAMNGRSSKSFRDEGHWVKALAEKPRYVLIQFGHNDQPGKGPERETDPATTYRANLARYISEAREIGAIPILVTSIVRRNFDGNGKIKRDPLVEYAEAVRKLGADENVPVIDLYALTRDQSERLGPKNNEPLGRKGPDGKLDTTHLGPIAQRDIGVMAAREFGRIVPSLETFRHDLVLWKDALRQRAPWYGSAEALRIADNLLLYQCESGGWEKNIDMAMPLGPKERAEVERAKHAGEPTIDNDATYTQLRFLAKVHMAARNEAYAAAFRKGLAYLFEAQYPNGGWPQFYPLRKGYYSHITYNDDAMIGVMELLRDIADRKPDFAFLTDADRAHARAAVQKGIECILKTQVTVNGKLTVWCAQHDEQTLAPAKARAYELVSLSGAESVGIVRFLMAIEKPSPDIVRSIQSAITWFSAAKVTGLRLERKGAPETPKGYDLIIVLDPAAPPLWGRFYDIPTNRVFFSGRDGVKKDSIAEIEYERRNGYRWYGDWPAKLLDDDYPKWMRKWSVGSDARR